jgi:hypothetical protein
MDMLILYQQHNRVEKMDRNNGLIKQCIRNGSGASSAKLRQ